MRVSIFLGSAGYNSGGPETYERKLVQHLAKIDNENDYRLLCLSSNAPEVVAVDKHNFHHSVLRPGFRPASMLFSLTYDQYANPADVMHATYLPPPVPVSKYIYTLVCSTIFQHPEFYPPAIRARLWFLTNLALRTARHTICISENIQQIVKERYSMSDEQLSVVHLAADPIFEPLAHDYCKDYLLDTYAIDAPYFFVCGRWEKRKNIQRIVRAFHKFCSEYDTDMKLVFSGERKWQSEQTQSLIDSLGVDGRVVDIGKSPFSELPILYSGATALVFPSLWEGFGLPIVESMACGTPVITSNISSTAEIAGDAALCIDPYSVDEIAESMYRLATDVRLHAELTGKGLARARQFSWERTARETLNIYDRFSGDKTA